MRDRERFMFEAFALECAQDFMHRFAFAGEDDIGWAVDRCNIDFIKIRHDCLAHRFFIGKHRGHAAIRRQGLHQTRARGNQLQAVFQTKHAGHACGHVFADAMAHHRARHNAPRTPQLRERIFERKERGLRVGSLIEEVGCWLLVARCWLLVARCSLLVAHSNSPLEGG